MPNPESLALFTLGFSIIIIAAIGIRIFVSWFTQPHPEETLEFLISDGDLIDTNFAAARLLDHIGSAASPLDRLRVFLAETFENSQQLLTPNLTGNDIRIQSRDGQVQASSQFVGGTIRLRITEINQADPDQNDIHTLNALNRELETLRANTSAAPFLLWRQNTDGEVTWVNQSYLNHTQSLAKTEEISWPLPVIFPSLRNLQPPLKSEARRLALPTTDEEQEEWFDCHISPVGKEILCTAIPANEAVRSEKRRREFTQTLTKTFAELAIGLTIFDRSRHLVLFNPAILDLTNLSTEFLTSRPSLISFLDRLRENRVMPEPRDYTVWREAIAQLEAAAVDGTYSETWSLPDGQTYHVTGRPHPDGAVALLFEDISAEMSLTRHFRLELEQAQSAIDALEDAVAVFSRAGDMTLSNSAYRKLWNIEQDAFLIGDITEETRRWHELTTPTPIWGDFREFAHTEQEREEWSETVSLRDGRRILCRFLPQKSGATMAVFRLTSQMEMGSIREAV